MDCVNGPRTVSDPSQRRRPSPGGVAFSQGRVGDGALAPMLFALGARPAFRLTARMSASVYHLEVWFSGRVQGVGFRARVMDMARAFEVTGRVANLDDGRVYLFAEGREREVADFLDSIEAAMPAYIRGVESKAGAGPRRHSDFLIAR